MQQRLEITGTSESTTSSSTALTTNKVDLVDRQALTTMQGMNAKNRCPNAFKVTDLLNRIFAQGIKLPTIEGSHIARIHFYCMTKGNGTLESVGYARGTQHWKGGEYLVSSVESAKKGDEGQTYQKLQQTFEASVAVAEGRQRPSCIPLNWQGNSQSFQASIEGPPQIREIED